MALDMLRDVTAIDTLRAARNTSTDKDERRRLAALEVILRIKYSLPDAVEGLRAIQMPYHENTRAKASARLWPASDSSAREWEKYPLTASTSTKSSVMPIESPSLLPVKVAVLP